MLSRFIPCGADANCVNLSNFANHQWIRFVKFALKKMRGCRSICCTYCLPFICLWLFSFSSLSLYGQDSVSMFMVDAGYASVHDSYLTPITYGGLDLGLSYEVMQPLRSRPDTWLWHLQVGADFNNVENDARNNDLQKLMGDVSFDMQRYWRSALARRVDLSVGPMTQLRAGIIYDEVNSNNPVSVRAHWNVGVAAMAAWHTRLGRKPVTLRYQVQLPVAGVFFAPEYDESYYEIYLGNRRNLAHLGWWGNRLDVTHYLGADLRMGKTTLRLGYRARLEDWTVNNLKVHDVSHALVLGISL